MHSIYVFHDIGGEITIDKVSGGVRLEIARLEMTQKPCERVEAYNLFTGTPFDDKIAINTRIYGLDIRENLLPFLAWITKL